MELHGKMVWSIHPGGRGLPGIAQRKYRLRLTLRFEREAALLTHVGRAGDDVVDLPLLHWERHRNYAPLYGVRASEGRGQTGAHKPGPNNHVLRTGGAVGLAANDEGVVVEPGHASGCPGRLLVHGHDGEHYEQLPVVCLRIARHASSSDQKGAATNPLSCESGCGVFTGAEGEVGLLDRIGKAKGVLRVVAPRRAAARSSLALPLALRSEWNE